MKIHRNQNSSKSSAQGEKQPVASDHRLPEGECGTGSESKTDRTVKSTSAEKELEKSRRIDGVREEFDRETILRDERDDPFAKSKSDVSNKYDKDSKVKSHVESDKSSYQAKSGESSHKDKIETKGNVTDHGTRSTNLPGSDNKGTHLAAGMGESTSVKSDGLSGDKTEGTRRPASPQHHGNDHNQMLHRLNDLDDFKVADDDPDIRGWKVKSKDGTTIGKVKDLIVDTDAMKVRYLDMEVKDKFTSQTGGDNIHLIVPIGTARLHKEDDDVYVERILTVEELRNYPTYRGDKLVREYEQEVVSFHEDSNLGRGTDPQSRAQGSDEPIVAFEEGHDGFYEKEYFNENKLYEHRNA